MEQVKGLVLYGSKYGSTRRYAQELARRLGFDCLDHRQATGQEAGQYPVIVYGGGLYAGGVTGLKQTCRRMEQPERAQWFFFTVGLADPAEAANQAHIRQGLAEQIPVPLARPDRFFHLRGAMDYSALSAAHRAMMWGLVQKLKHTPAPRRTPEDEQLLATYGQRIDFVDLASLEPLCQALTAAVEDF